MFRSQLLLGKLLPLFLIVVLVTGVVSGCGLLKDLYWIETEEEPPIVDPPPPSANIEAELRITNTSCPDSVRFSEFTFYRGAQILDVFGASGVVLEVTHGSAEELTFGLDEQPTFVSLKGVWGNRHSLDFDANIGLTNYQCGTLQMSVPGEEWTLLSDTLLENRHTREPFTHILVYRGGTEEQTLIDIEFSLYEWMQLVRLSLDPGECFRQESNPIYSEVSQEEGDYRWRTRWEQVSLNCSGVTTLAYDIVGRSTNERGRLLFELRPISQISQGRAVAEEYGCVACHTVDGAQSIGPSWEGLYGRRVTLSDGSTLIADEQYIRESIRLPGEKIVAGFPNAMPPFSLSEQEFEELLAYLKSLAE